MKIFINRKDLDEAQRLFSLRDKVEDLQNACQNESQALIELKCIDLSVATTNYSLNRQRAETAYKEALLYFEKTLQESLKEASEKTIKFINDKLIFTDNINK